MDEKKKLAVVGVLFVLVIGIGAFQFVGGSEPPPAPPKSIVKKEDAADETLKPKNPSVAFPLTTRDPFEGPSEPKPTVERVAERPQPRSKPEGSGLSGNGFKPVIPDQVAGVPTLPGAGAAPVVHAEEHKFGYSIAGVLVGPQSVAVFKDSSGSQRMVKEGASLDGDTKVISIQKDKVVVSYRGKTLELTNGGNTSAK